MPTPETHRKQFYADMRAKSKALSQKIKNLTQNVQGEIEPDFTSIFAEYGSKTPASEVQSYDAKDFAKKGHYPEWWKDTYLNQNTINAHEFMAEHLKNGGGLTEEFIKELHQKFYAGYDREIYLKLSGRKEDGTAARDLGDRLVSPGEYRKGEMAANEHTIFKNETMDENSALLVTFTPSKEVPQAMQDFVAKHAKPGKDPIAKAAKIYGDFIKIHPFDDGNGRMGRALLNFELMRGGLLPIHTKGEQLDGYTLAQCSVDYHFTKDSAGMEAFIASREIAELEKALGLTKAQPTKAESDKIAYIMREKCTEIELELYIGLLDCMSNRCTEEQYTQAVATRMQEYDDLRQQLYGADEAPRHKAPDEDALLTVHQNNRGLNAMREAQSYVAKVEQFEKDAKITANFPNGMTPLEYANSLIKRHESLAAEAPHHSKTMQEIARRFDCHPSRSLVGATQKITSRLDELKPQLAKRKRLCLPMRVRIVSSFKLAAGKLLRELEPVARIKDNIFSKIRTSVKQMLKTQPAEPKDATTPSFKSLPPPEEKLKAH